MASRSPQTFTRTSATGPRHLAHTMAGWCRLLSGGGYAQSCGVRSFAGLLDLTVLPGAAGCGPPHTGVRRVTRLEQASALGSIDMTQRWARVLVVTLLSAAMAACSSSASPSPGANGNNGNGGGGGGVTFVAQIVFTGFIPIQGSFTDSSSASSATSCSGYASNGLKPQSVGSGPTPTAARSAVNPWSFHSPSTSRNSMAPGHTRVIPSSR
jgi:hypothetical protein